MPPPPPPPPPGAPPPPTVKSSGRPMAKKSGGATDRGALLSAIHKGTALKKTVTNDRSAPVLGGNKPSPGGGGRGAGPLMPPGGGASKFNTVACHNNRPNSRELPNSWRGSQDDGVAKNNLINQKRKQSLSGAQNNKQPLKPSFSDGGGTPTPAVVGGLGGLFAGGVPRLPSANKRQQGGQRGPGPAQALRPPGPRMTNGPSVMSNGPGRNIGGPPPPPPSNTKPNLNQRPISNGQSRPGPPPPPPSQNKPGVASSPGKLSNDDRNGHVRGSNTSLNSNSSRISFGGDSSNTINNNARPRSGVTGGVPRSQPPPPPNRPPPTTAPGKSSGQWPPPPPPQSAKASGPPPPPPQSAKTSGPPPPPPQSAKSGAPPPPPPQSAKGPGNRPPSMVGRPLPPPPSQGAPPPPPPSNRPPPPPSSSLKPAMSNRPSSARANQPPPPPSQPPSRQGGPPPPPPTRTTSAQNGGTLPRAPGVKPPPPPMRGPQSTGAMPPPPPQRRSGNYSGGSDDFENRFRFHNANECPPPEPFSKMNKTYPSKNPRNPGKNTGARAPPPPPPK